MIAEEDGEIDTDLPGTLLALVNVLYMFAMCYACRVPHTLYMSNISFIVYTFPLKFWVPVQTFPFNTVCMLRGGGGVGEVLGTEKGIMLMVNNSYANLCS